MLTNKLMFSARDGEEKREKRKGGEEESEVQVLNPWGKQRVTGEIGVWAR